LSNPNIIGPYGSQTVQYGAGGSFDEAGYNRAMNSFNSRPVGAAPTQSQFQKYKTDREGENGEYVDDVQAYENALSNFQSSRGVAPTREQYTTGADMDIPTVTQTLTPDAMETLKAQQDVQKNLAYLGQRGIGTAQDVLSNRFNPNLPGLQTSLDTSNIARMPVNAGTTGQEALMSRLAPQIERQQASTRQVLANQGITQGSEAYRNAMTQQGQQENDLRTQAALQGLNLDIGANTQGFNQAIQGAQFGNTAQQQSLAQQLALRNQPLNEISGLMSGSQIQTPQFQGYTGANIAAAPIFGAAQAQGQADMQNYGIAQAGANAQMAGLGNLAGTLGGAAIKYGMFASDRRLKSNIVKVGTHPLGIGIYEYDIFGERQRGVMADEVEKVMPEAVMTHESGYKMVDYGALNA
jgi:hypothetical protein